MINLALISLILESGKYVQRGPAKGYVFKDIETLPEGESFEHVENYREKVQVYNERFWHRKRNKNNMLFAYVGTTDRNRQCAYV